MECSFFEVVNRDGSKVIMHPFQTLAHEMMHAAHYLAGERYITTENFTWQQNFADGVHPMTVRMESEELATHSHPDELNSIRLDSKQPGLESARVLYEAFDEFIAESEGRARINAMHELREVARSITEYRLIQETGIGAREFYIPFPAEFNLLTFEQSQQSPPKAHLRLFDARGAS